MGSNDLMNLAKVQTPKLKPEIRLAQAISEFAASLDDGRRATFKTLQTNSPPSPTEVIRLTEEINRDGARMHRSWQPHGTRLVGILERIQVFSAVGDILIGGSQCMIASGVWAAVRMSLQLATGYLSYFERISQLFMRIGHSSSIQQDLVLLFPKCSKLQRFMCEYLIVIVNFCRGVVVFTKRSILAQLATSFDNEFKSFETDLSTWTSIIHDQVTYLTAKLQLRSGRTLVATNNALALITGPKAKKREIAERLARILAKISPHNRSSTSTGAWLDSSSSSVLQITGALGSGKSVLLANVFATICSQNGPDPQARIKSVPASFFCYFGNAKSLEPRNILGSIMYQFIKQLMAEPAVADVLAAKLPQHTLDMDIDEVVNIAQIMPLDRRFYVVLDALDECGEQAVEEVVVALSRLLQSCQIQLCFSTRVESKAIGIIEQHLKVEHKISMANAERKEELKAFIEHEINRRQDQSPRSLDPTVLAAVKNDLSAKADGMYLWAALQIDALFPRYHRQRILCDADILSMLETLPADLPRAFDRALGRITERRYGSRVFEIAAAARRPLSLDEFRVALNVQPGITEWNEATLPHDAQDVIFLSGGGLLEVEEEDLTVRFIHSSARQHLESPSETVSDHGIGTFHYSPVSAAANLGFICVTYLNYPIFEKQVVKVDKALVPIEQVAAGVSSTVVREVKKDSLLRAVASTTSFLRLGAQGSRKPNALHISLDKAVKTALSESIAHIFFPYARENWLWYTMELLLLDELPGYRESALQLLKKDLSFLGLPVPSPGNPGSPAHDIGWAIENQHIGLFFYCLISNQKIPGDMAVSGAEFISRWPESVRMNRRYFDDLVARLVAQGEHCPFSKLQDLLDLVIKRGADPSIPLAETSQTPLDLCFNFHGQEILDLLNTLLQGGADPNCSLGMKGSILFHAISLGDSELVSLLLSFGAEANVPAVFDNSTRHGYSELFSGRETTTTWFQYSLHTELKWTAFVLRTFPYNSQNK
ncbi:hypothetical protein QBC46DRAFT_358398 [Diplogelasinospora grovesii]|uniref:Nephrocystin 3-like N-terminal domain-containing protein n=1 Tax=Diplogelasinospora grovesii TaxID=303347 RepID=A0AAN6MY79_9PEZI|nr:hypothetical protein QBC46DRAFT_358398 [Diplogelasinospora grovesii]